MKPCILYFRASLSMFSRVLVSIYDYFISSLSTELRKMQCSYNALAQPPQQPLRVGIYILFGSFTNGKGEFQKV